MPTLLGPLSLKDSVLKKRRSARAVGQSRNRFQAGSFSGGVLPYCSQKAPTVDDTDPASLHIHHVTIIPRALAYQVMRDFHHQQ